MKNITHILIIISITITGFMSTVSAGELFIGQLTVRDEATELIIDSVPITGKIFLGTQSVKIDDVVVDGSLMQLPLVGLRGPGVTLIGGLGTDSQTVNTNQIGARFSTIWKGLTRPFVNVWNPLHLPGNLLLFPPVAPGASIPGGLISPDTRIEVVIYNLSTVQDAFIHLDDGLKQECNATGGRNNVALNTRFNLAGLATSATVDWTINGIFSGSGDTLNTFLPFGVNVIEASIQADTGEIKVITESLEIRDTTPPTVITEFHLDGSVITTVPANSASDVEIAIVADDICDASPVITNSTLTPVYMVNDGDIIMIQATGDRVELETTAIQLNVTVSATGGTTSSNATLEISN